jgi:L-arabinose isomerase
MKKTTIGLLPLYLELYDECSPILRDRLDPFYNKITKEFEDRGFSVIKSKFCRREREFEDAVKNFERDGADCIITLHMAYSPSLESSDVLSKTQLPLIILDTTETFDFSPNQSPSEINYNHGIHGVMDMCNLLKRNKKIFAIAAGHYKNSDVIDRVCGYINAAISATSLRNSIVGIIGESFKGMGDFLISKDEILSRFGVTLVEADFSDLENLRKAVIQEEIDNEIYEDLKSFELIDVSKESHERTIRSCLATRKWIDQNQLSAFTVNFKEVYLGKGLDVVPFMEASKSLSRRTGYAGEGDILTASFVGALLKGFEKTSFIEIFCPDWKGDTLMISHMGEMNLSLAANKPELKEMDFTYTDAHNPVVAYGCYKEGNAVFINIFNDGTDYTMLLSPVKMIEPKADNFKESVRGWLKPNMPIAAFLEQISQHGVTHHSILVYDASISELEYFGKILGLKIVVI